jgi:hypothetical protein
MVFYQLIYLYDNIATTVAQRNAVDPDHATSRLEGARRFFGLSSDGYRRMGTVLSAAKGQLDALLSAQTQFASTINASTPGATVESTLQSLYAQENALLRGVSTSLRAQLTPADWNVFQSFLQTELVAKIHVGAINK